MPQCILNNTTNYCDYEPEYDESDYSYNYTYEYNYTCEYTYTYEYTYNNKKLF